ncbi:Type 2A phosphatase-associated protein 42 [Knufia obscura]|uniref:Type 2A phosphatase-associated protein 42 n=2 Tax=Knufia TaxID=430999 RepID=A0AAN8IAJ2_9EURO|nr:Type 2A phosphatase-associated protein 42 [Knufia obscura]KAK5955640.1 Type 2A phosphatase-associated protein 42 [Knufia fluminis]
MAQEETPENEQSLSSLFQSAKNSQGDLDTLDPRSEDFKSLLASSIDTLQRCSKLVDQLALFSTNEDLEDVSTSNIQYLGIDYLLSELTMRSYSPTDRKSQLNNASDLLEHFLIRLDEYSLLSPPDKKLLESYKEGRTQFRIIGDNAGMEAKRNTKIKRFQDEKALKSKLKLLNEQSQSLNVDDEVIRNLYLAEIQLFVHQAFQSLDLISQERQILASMPSQPDPNRRDHPQAQSDDRDHRNGTANRQAYSERLDPSELLNGSRPHRGILDSGGRPLQPFTITSKRTDLRKGVFRPGHSLPTMSIDEYLEEEHKRGGIIDGGGPASERVIEPDEDDQAAQDAATMKAREWDEYVEANPKGAGNTINRG